MVECVSCVLIFLVRLLGRHEMDVEFLVASLLCDMGTSVGGL